MSAELRVPKRELRAEVLLAGMAPLQVQLFLAEQTPSHSGFERPSDFLNRGVPFLPAVGLDGAPQVLRREAVLRISVARSAELADEEPSDDGRDAPEIVRLDLEVGFDTGDTARGRLVFVQPENRRRLVDYLNDCPQFFCLRDDDRVHIVNKARVARVSLRGNSLLRLTRESPDLIRTQPGSLAEQGAQPGAVALAAAEVQAVVGRVPQHDTLRAARAAPQQRRLPATGRPGGRSRRRRRERRAGR